MWKWRTITFIWVYLVLVNIRFLDIAGSKNVNSDVFSITWLITRPQILYVVRRGERTLHDIELVAKADGELIVTAALFHDKQRTGQIFIDIAELYKKAGLDLYPHTTGAAYFNQFHRKWRQSWSAMGFEVDGIRSAQAWTTTARLGGKLELGRATFGPLSFQEISWCLNPFSKSLPDP